MKNVLITGSGGQIGSELTLELRKRLGGEHVIASDKREITDGPLAETGPVVVADVTDAQELAVLVKKYNIDTIYHLAAVLSAVGEAKPQLA
ncbi:MAG: NAD-dependent epimerase/dehydratase family protein, partial [Bacteroidetes bacterium]|nr:NAD-dependent epimerase/dehydratase family protein [Bacteroidota bacterium]